MSETTPDEWQKWRANPGVETSTPGDWPKGVRPISTEGISLLGVDSDNRLYFDGRPVEMRRSIHLEKWQAALACIATTAGVVAAVAAAVTAYVDLQRLP